MYKTWLALSLIFTSSLLLGGCTLLEKKTNKNDSSTVNNLLLVTPQALPTQNLTQNDLEDVNLGPLDDFDSINSDLDQLDNLEKVELE